MYVLSGPPWFYQPNLVLLVCVQRGTNGSKAKWCDPHWPASCKGSHTAIAIRMESWSDLNVDDCNCARSPKTWSFTPLIYLCFSPSEFSQNWMIFHKGFGSFWSTNLYAFAAPDGCLQVVFSNINGWQRIYPGSQDPTNRLVKTYHPE